MKQNYDAHIVITGTERRVGFHIVWGGIDPGGHMFFPGVVGFIHMLQEMSIIRRFDLIFGVVEPGGCLEGQLRPSADPTSHVQQSILRRAWIFLDIGGGIM